MDVFRISIESSCGLITDLLATAEPENPAEPIDPTNGVEAQRYLRNLQGAVAYLDPIIDELSTVLNSLSQNQTDAQKYLSTVKKSDQATTTFAQFLTTQNVTTLLRDGRKRLRDWRSTRNDWNVKSQTLIPGTVTATTTDSSSYLPRIKLRNFDGKASEWPEFWELFTSTVDRSNDPATRKLNFLKSLMVGDAKDLLKGITLSDTNYQVAKDVLINRFGDPQQHLRLLTTRLSNLKPCKSFVEIQAFYSELDSLCRQMTSLGQPVKGLLHLQQIESKLPRRYLSDLWKKQEEYTAARKDWDVEELRSELLKLIKREEQLTRTIESGTSSFSSTTTRSRYSDRRSKQTDRTNSPKNSLTFVTNTADKSNMAVSKFRCSFCQQLGHTSGRCPTYSTFEQKTERAKKLHICLRCLGKGHFIHNCSKPITCTNCRKPHYRFMCPSSEESSSSTTLSSRSPKSSQPSETLKKGNISQNIPPPVQAAANCHANCTPKSTAETETSTLLMCTEATVYSPNEPQLQKTVLCFLDPGSTHSYITDELVEALKLPELKKEQLNIFRFNQIDPEALCTEQYSLSLKTNIGPDMFLPVTRIQNIASAVPYVNINSELVESLRHEYHIYLPIKQGTPSLLLGIDHVEQLEPKVICQFSSGFVLKKTRIGPILCGRGRVENRNDLAPNIVATAFRANDNSLDEQMSRFLEIEAIGLSDVDGRNEDEAVQKTFRDTIKFLPTSDNQEKGRYEIHLPWLSDLPTLPSNYSLAFGRLRSIHKHLDENQIKAYDAIFQEQLSLQIIEKVEKPWISAPKTHYLAHQPVWKSDSDTTSLRVVFDASAKSSSTAPSINECLYRGKVYAGHNESQIAGILMRFRLMPFVLIGDLEKAFLQISVTPSDRDALRFLWKSELEPGQKADVYRFCRVPFGLRPSPYLLGAVIEEHIKKFPKEETNGVLENLYVDNILVPVKDKNLLVSTINRLRYIFNCASFNLRKLTSDALTELESIPTELREIKTQFKLLGILWSPLTNLMEIRFPTSKCSSKEFVLTKRTLLSISHSVFDPVGYSSPCLLPLKLLLSDTWKLKFGWDDQLPLEIEAKFKLIIATWTNPLSFIQFFRRLFEISDLTDPEVKFELHIFSDASSSALGVAAYLRLISSHRVKSGLIFAKSMIVPSSLRKTKKDGDPKLATIPKLELHATHIAAKIIPFLTSQLKLDNLSTTLWTDSQNVIFWLKQKTNPNVFIRSRVQKIRNYPVCHVRSSQNPADISTRGATINELQHSSLWWNGPQWLSDLNLPDTINFLPSQKCQNFSLLIIDAPSNASSLVDFERYSNLYKLERITVFAFLFISRVKAFVSFKNPILRSFNGLPQQFTVDHLKWAELLLVWNVQQLYAPDQNMRNNLDIFSDEFGLLRCRGRFENCRTFNFNEKFPLYLPKDSWLTVLIIRQLHLRMLHAGPNTTIAELRRKFWLPTARRTVRNILFRNPKTKCVTCFKFVAKPALDKPTPPLPIERINIAAPFSYCGVDYFGPLRVRNETGNKNETIKVWGVMWVCHISRAVHLEIARDASAKEFILAFRKFAARRGTPKFIYSDNATNLKLGSQVIQKIWRAVFEDPTTEEYMTKNFVTWKFCVEKAPWRAGCYERLVSNIKHHLRRSLGSKYYDYVELETIFAEIEFLVNSRPLTTLIEGEVTKIIRPLDLLSPFDQTPVTTVDRQIDDPTDPDFVLKKDPINELLIHYHNSKLKIDDFWSAWHNQYLADLRETSKICRPNKGNELSVGQTVIIADDQIPRSQWKIGVIHQLIESSDKHIRTALVRTNPHRHILRRPIKSLFPLEIESEMAHPPLCTDFKDVDQEVPLLQAEDRDNEVEEENPLTQRPNRLPNRTRTRVIRQPKRFINFSTLLTIFYLIISLSNATRQLMRCLTQNNPIFWRIDTDKVDCSNYTQFDRFDSTEKVFLEIYRPNVESQTISAFHCAILKTHIMFWENLITDHKQIVSTTIQPISHEECQRMAKHSECQYGKLIDGSTNNVPQLDYSYWSTQHNETFNCKINPIFLHIMPSSLSMSTSTEDISTCKYKDQSCLLSDGSVIIWDSDDKHVNICPYVSIGKLEGHLEQGLWINKNREIALSFPTDIRETFSCGQSLVLSDQGYAIQADKYHSKFHFLRKAKRQNDVKAGIVYSEQLASQLTAENLNSLKNIRISTSHFLRLLCQDLRGSNRWKKLLNGISASTVARTFLGDYIKARWAGENLLEIHPCHAIQTKSLRFIRTDQCYIFPKVNYTTELGGKVYSSFLNPETFEITDYSETGSCSEYRFLSIKIDGKIRQIDQITGASRLIESDIHILNIDHPTVAIPFKLEAHRYHDWIVTEARNIQAEIDKNWRISRRDSGLLLATHTKEIEQDSERTDKSPLIELSWPTFNISWFQIWTFVCCLYISISFTWKYIVPIIMKYGLLRLGIRLSRDQPVQTENVQPHLSPSNVIPVISCIDTSHSETTLRREPSRRRFRPTFYRAEAIPLSPVSSSIVPQIVEPSDSE